MHKCIEEQSIFGSLCIFSVWLLIFFHKTVGGTEKFFSICSCNLIRHWIYTIRSSYCIAALTRSVLSNYEPYQSRQLTGMRTSGMHKSVTFKISFWLEWTKTKPQRAGVRDRRRTIMGAWTKCNYFNHWMQVRAVGFKGAHIKHTLWMHIIIFIFGSYKYKISAWKGMYVHTWGNTLYTIKHCLIWFDLGVIITMEFLLFQIKPLHLLE